MGLQAGIIYIGVMGSGGIESRDATASSSEVTVGDIAAPTVSGIGVSDPEMPTISWEGSAPESISQLLEAVPAPLQIKEQRKIIGHLLMMPVPPETEDNVPADWLGVRLEKLQVTGLYEEAAKLMENVPEKMPLSDRAMRAGVDALFQTGKISKACKYTESMIAREEGDSPYWPLRVSFCHQIQGNEAEADLSWQLTKENHGKEISPLERSFFEFWGSEDKSLPTLSANNAEFEPLLSAALTENDDTNIAKRIPADWVNGELAPRISPPLAAQLSQLEQIPLPVRFELGERAGAYGLLIPPKLRALYDEMIEQPDLWKTLPPEVQFRLGAYQGLMKVSASATRMSQLEKAIPLFVQKFGDEYTFRLFGDQMEWLLEGLDTLKPSLELSQNIAQFALDDKRKGDARMVADYLRTTTYPEARSAAMAIDLAATLSEGDMIRTVDLKVLPPEEQNGWVARRIHEVFSALGAEADLPAATYTGSPPLMAPPPSVISDKLRNAKANRLRAEKLLASALLLQSGSLDQVGDSVTQALISNLDEEGFDKLSRQFAQLLLLHAPTP